MKLPKKTKDIESIPEQFRALYSEGDDGTYALAVEIESGPDPRVAEFRDENIKLRRQLEGFDGIDPEAYRKLQQAAAEDEEKKLLSAGKIDELVERRSLRMREEFEGALKAKAKALEEAAAREEALVGKLSGFMIDDATTKAIGEVARVRPGAEADLRARARGIFRVDPATGGLIPDASGKVEYGKNSDPLSIEEWAKGLVDSAPHLFEAPRGANAADGDGPELPGRQGPDRSARVRRKPRGDRRGEARLMSRLLAKLIEGVPHGFYDEFVAARAAGCRFGFDERQAVAEAFDALDAYPMPITVRLEVAIRASAAALFDKFGEESAVRFLSEAKAIRLEVAGDIAPTFGRRFLLHEAMLAATQKEIS